MKLPFKIKPSAQAFRASFFINIIALIFYFILNGGFSINDLGYFLLTFFTASIILENFLTSYKSRLEEINILKDQENYRREFLGNVSHELKTPLFTIQGYILTLIEGALKDKKVRGKYLRRSAKGVDRLISIVKDLDLITQFESGIKTVDKTNFNIYELIENVYDLMEFESEKNNIKLLINNKNITTVTVNADKERILQVLTNLIVNSIKYGKENGYTEVKVEEYDKDRIIVRVKDNGEGIEDEHLPRLFERFYRIDKNRSRKKGGSGLGLSIVKHIIDDLAFTQNIITTKNDILSILKKIQDLDPPGVGARSLQECLLIQLNKKTNSKESIFNSIKIIESEFELFSKKKFTKLSEKLNLSDSELKAAINEISKLNPKPGGSITSEFSNNTIIPDFILKIQDGELIVELNKRNSPELKLSNSYKDILEGYKNDPNKSKSQNQAIQFLKQKLDSAKWFIEAVEQRYQTLFQTVNAIVTFQNDYFLSGEESDLKPMILKDIAEKINMDISTVSRVANSKYIDTPYGIKLLKSYFSEGMVNKDGDEISTIEIKKTLKLIIESEDKAKPLSDIELSENLSNKGYKVARRTVSKYREQLDIPVARLRKELQ